MYNMKSDKIMPFIKLHSYYRAAPFCLSPWSVYGHEFVSDAVMLVVTRWEERHRQRWDHDKEE